MKKVLILFGGVSSEHEVSLVSAAGVLANIDRTKYDVIPVGITKDGAWRLMDGKPITEDALSDASLPSVAVDPGRHGIIILRGDKCDYVKVDAVFPVMHGANGEDGTMQGLFAIAGIPCVGSDCEASAIGMDKAATKAVLNQAGIRQAEAVVLESSDIHNDGTAEMLESALGYPMFVKPSRAGSSVGISKVKTPSELIPALEEAAAHDTKLLIEKYIKGREIEVAVLEENGSLTVSVPAEIDPGCEFYDYDAKYNTDTSSFYIPARVSEDEAADVRALAARIFTLLGCSGLSRVDFFIRPDGEFVFNEINTLPGFTPISMYPKLMQHAGLSYTELISRLIEAAIKTK